MMKIDPRLADRRREVAEDRARRNVSRLLRILIVAAVIGGTIWLLLSPTFSVDAVDVAGVQSSDTRETLVAHQVVDGRPLILIRTGAVEEELLDDPWVKAADVSLDWPRGVTVTITERTPAAWVETRGGWARRAIDGVALPGGGEPDDTMAHISLPGLADAASTDDPALLGALAFVDALPVSLASNALVEERSGELWAVVAGYDVRLGRPVEMSDKALSLAALLAQEPVAGSVINMLAPTNPSVVPPGQTGGPDPGEDAGSGAGEDDQDAEADQEGQP